MSFNVLVVDDSVVARTYLIKSLTVAKFPVVELFQAGNGKDALKILKAKWVDLVFVDINMPEMNGVDLIAAMRVDVVLKTTPVIVVSSMGQAVQKERTSALGVSVFVQKPFTPELLRSVAFEALEALHAAP